MSCGLKNGFSGKNTYFSIAARPQGEQQQQPSAHRAEFCTHHNLVLATLDTQTASALAAIRTAEELADERERKVWDHLSVFVPHDIKNAATMLALRRKNASATVHNPEFQNDMLEAIDDALARMGKLQARLMPLQEEVTPEWRRLHDSRKIFRHPFSIAFRFGPHPFLITRKFNYITACYKSTGITKPRCLLAVLSVFLTVTAVFNH